jgi:hypothetical protein
MPTKTGAKRHTHKYQKLSDGLWYCSLADCTHFMPKNMANRVIGLRSICWNCGNEMILDEDNMKHDRPFCAACKMKLAGITPEDLLKFIAKKTVETKESSPTRATNDIMEDEDVYPR